MISMRKSVAAMACAGMVAVFTPRAYGATIDIVATADGEVFLSGGNATLGSTTQAFNTTQNVVPGQEWRSVYEFDLPLLTEQIVSATFIGAVTGNSAPPATLSFFGYSGNGVVEASDATQISTLFGSANLTQQVLSPPGFLSLSVPLTASLVESLGSGFLGLTTTVGTGDTVLVASLESTAFARPTLRLETLTTVVPPGPDGPPAVVPEPGTMVLIGSGLAGVIARRRRRATASKA